MLRAPDAEGDAELSVWKSAFRAYRESRRLIGRSPPLNAAVFEAQKRRGNSVFPGFLLKHMFIFPVFCARRRRARQARAWRRFRRVRGRGERFAETADMPFNSDIMIFPIIPSWSLTEKSFAETLLPSVANDSKSALHSSSPELSNRPCGSYAETFISTDSSDDSELFVTVPFICVKSSGFFSSAKSKTMVPR